VGGEGLEEQVEPVTVSPELCREREETRGGDGGGQERGQHKAKKKAFDLNPEADHETESRSPALRTLDQKVTGCKGGRSKRKSTRVTCDPQKVMGSNP